MVNLYCLIFTDVRTHAHYVLDNRAYFTGLIFKVRQSSAKMAKVGPLEKFPTVYIALANKDMNHALSRFTDCLCLLVELSSTSLASADRFQ